MEKGTKEILKNIAIIVLVPTVLVGAYYGGKFIHKKYKQKKDKEKNNEDKATKDNATDTSTDAKLKTNKDGSIDTTGMVKYMIEIPSNLREKLFTNGEFFDAILKVPYAFDNIGSEGSKGISVSIKMLPENLKKMDDIVKKINKEISIVPIT